MPRLLAMLCVLAVFIPAFFMQGAAKALFVPLALAVGFSMVASFILSSTLVPVLCVWLLQRSADFQIGTNQNQERAGSETGAPVHDPRFIAKLQSTYARLLRPIVAARWLLVLVYLVASLGTVWFVGKKLGTEIFPSVDSVQLALRLRAPTGTKVENTEQFALKVFDLIKCEAGATTSR